MLWKARGRGILDASYVNGLTIALPSLPCRLWDESSREAGGDLVRLAGREDGSRLNGREYIRFDYVWRNNR